MDIAGLEAADEPGAEAVFVRVLLELDADRRAGADHVGRFDLLGQIFAQHLDAVAEWPGYRFLTGHRGQQQVIGPKILDLNLDDPVVLCERHPRAPVDPSALTIESDPKRSKSDSARYGIWVVGWPGLVTVITPAQLHMQIETLSSAGWLSSRSVIAPGTQGVIVAGIQGCGVSTPSAAEVAAATAGLAMLVHMPNGMMLTIEMWSVMFAAN